MHICVRLPNWLGDVMMSLGMLQLLRQVYPSATISVVIKQGLEPLVQNLPYINDVFIFSKTEYKGATGAWAFGKQLARKQAVDVFFVLPDSFSSALMAMASGAKQRIGYRKEGRRLLLTHAYPKANRTSTVRKNMQTCCSDTIPQLETPISATNYPTTQRQAQLLI